MGKLNSETTHLKSAPGAQQAIAPSDEGDGRLFLDLTHHPDYPFEHREIEKAIIYQLHLEAEGVPEILAEEWAQGVARRVGGSMAPTDQLTHGLYCYFVGAR